MSDGHASATLLRRLMAAAQAKSEQLICHMHPGWVRAALPGLADGPLAWPIDVGGRVRLSAKLAALHQVRWPGLPALRSRLHRVALLGLPLMLRVLAAAALYQHRDAVRHCIGRDARRHLMDLVGGPAHAALLDSPVATDPRTQAQAPGVPMAAAVEVWAAHGYRLLHAQRLWTCPDAAAVARLAFAPGTFEPPGGSTPQPGAMTDFFQRLDIFFPEQSWLFGSDMDRALSGSTMASCATPTSRP